MTTNTTAATDFRTERITTTITSINIAMLLLALVL